jgi:hypothetical protein
MNRSRSFQPSQVVDLYECWPGTFKPAGVARRSWRFLCDSWSLMRLWERVALLTSGLFVSFWVGIFLLTLVSVLLTGFFPDMIPEFYKDGLYTQEPLYRP